MINRTWLGSGFRKGQRNKCWVGTSPERKGIVFLLLNVPLLFDLAHVETETFQALDRERLGVETLVRNPLLCTGVRWLLSQGCKADLRGIDLINES